MEVGIDSFAATGWKVGHSPDKLTVGLHSLSYVAESRGSRQRATTSRSIELIGKYIIPLVNEA